MLLLISCCQRAIKTTRTQRQMIEDLGDALDLSSIADAIPDNADLLEQEDDAPIIVDQFVA